MITSFCSRHTPLVYITLCAIVFHSLMLRISSDDADFPWGRFPDDQVRQIPVSSRRPTPSPQPTPLTPFTGHHLLSPLTRLNDVNGINRNFTANRGAFGFRKPKKSKQEVKPAVSKQFAALQAKHAKLLVETNEKRVKH